MKASAVYVEKTLANHPRVASILERTSKAPVIYCNHYGEIFNRNNQNFKFQKLNPSLILAKKTNNFVLPVPKNYTLDAPGFYFSHMLNCIYDCRYCFLQGMFNSAHYVLFVNYEDFFNQIKTIYENQGPKLWFFSGYDCDSLALDPITNFSVEFLDFFKPLKHATLELRTKSTQVRALLKNSRAQSNVVCSFSLNPQEIISDFEHKTPSLSARISAANKLLDAGWQVGLRLDPVIVTPKFKETYGIFLERLKEEINNDLHSVTIGEFRLRSSHFKKMQKLYPNEWLFKSITKESGKTISYRKAVQEETNSWIARKLKHLNFKAPVYFHTD